MNPLIWQFEQYEALNLNFLPSLVLDLDPIFYLAHKNSGFSDDLISQLINPPGLWESFYWTTTQDFWDLGGRHDGRENESVP